MDDLGDEKIDSKFRYVLLAARRAEQLIRGARPRIDSGAAKTARVAMEEVRAGKIDWDYGPAPEPEALEEEGAVAEGEVSEADVH